MWRETILKGVIQLELTWSEDIKGVIILGLTWMRGVNILKGIKILGIT